MRMLCCMVVYGRMLCVHSEFFTRNVNSTSQTQKSKRNFLKGLCTSKTTKETKIASQTLTAHAPTRSTKVLATHGNSQATGKYHHRTWSHQKGNRLQCFIWTTTEPTKAPHNRKTPKNTKKVPTNPTTYPQQQ